MNSKFLPAALLFINAFILSTGIESARAVVPPPDGGYPGFNTAEGQNALFSLTSGAANTAVGWFSLKSLRTGNFNTGLGAGTLVLNSGDENTAVGATALLVNSASGNTGVGSRALQNNTTGGTLENIKGVAFGPNVAVGQEALASNTVSSANTAVGYQALHSFVSGPSAFERFGLNTAVGFQTLANAIGIQNTALGYQALFNDADGSVNTAIGYQALFNNTSGINNTAIGFGAGFNVTTANHVICLGTDVQGANVDNSCYIGGIWSQPGGSQAVFVDATGKLGAQVSSRRFKEEIKKMDKASESLFALTPVSFRYKKEIDPAGTAQFGLVAEDVEKVNPDLVIRDKEGKPYTVRYDQVNAMLLNEFLKEHRKNEQQEATIALLKSTDEKQEATIAKQQKQIDALAAGLQKVSAQLQVTKAAPQTASIEQ